MPVILQKIASKKKKEKKKKKNLFHCKVMPAGSQVRHFSHLKKKQQKNFPAINRNISHSAIFISHSTFCDVI